MDQDKTTNIRKLNDMLRGQRIGGRILITPGVQGLGLDSINLLLEEVANYDGFGSQNDPWDEHDGAAIVFQGQRYYWKIDYYDQTLKYGSPDPSDPLVTERVLTLMRSDEY
ncbi:MAG: DUF3768 domain-containing protein [Rhodospirillaceae bacterium]|nr:DUF3768 domain-containing protein [Rhodospirillaceae bacterium]